MYLLKLIAAVFLHKNFIGSEAANILAYYPAASISHQVVFRPITLELLKRGHRVTVITSNPIFSNESSRPSNLTEIDVHDLSYKISRNNFTKTVTGKQDTLTQFKVLTDMQSTLLEEQFKIQEVQHILFDQTKKYDLLLLEASCYHLLAVTHKISAPTILISSFGAFPGNYETMGVSTNPFIYHNVGQRRLYNLSWWEKVTEVFNAFAYMNIMNSNEKKFDKVLQKIFGPDMPSMSDLKNNVDMLFLNINPIWEGNVPVPPNVIHLGGLHINPPKELPRDLQNYLDDSKYGVIYFSLGTNVKPSLLSPEKITIFEKVFSELPYNIIWKWDTPNHTSKSKNIKFIQWLPQADVLRHPNVKVFITQGGLQSTDEAIAGGVPLIGIPMLGDQWYNVEKYVHHKIGLRLDLTDLTENKLRAAIYEVTKTESYRNNIRRLRALMEDQPQTPLQRAIWWIEYVLRHGGAKHLRAPAANMSWYEFLELHLVFHVLVATFIFLILLIALIKFITYFVKKYWLVKKLKKK